MKFSLTIVSDTILIAFTNIVVNLLAIIVGLHILAIQFRTVLSSVTVALSSGLSGFAERCCQSGYTDRKVFVDFNII